VTTISFELPAAADVALTIYNLQGQVVRTLVRGASSAGVHSLIWDARDEAGMAVPTGIYYYRLRTGNQVLTRKLLLAK